MRADLPQLVQAASAGAAFGVEGLAVQLLDGAVVADPQAFVVVRAGGGRDAGGRGRGVGGQAVAGALTGVDDGGRAVADTGDDVPGAEEVAFGGVEPLDVDAGACALEEQADDADLCVADRPAAHGEAVGVLVDADVEGVGGPLPVGQLGAGHGVEGDGDVADIGEGDPAGRVAVAGGDVADGDGGGGEGEAHGGLLRIDGGGREGGRPGGAGRPGWVRSPTRS
ncbi:hypothetical protein ACPCBF_25065 [Streptomyces pseudogriseolus]|uniref:hypothetical protein n=1 Tax=Streptomyces pseudogriseolus TaxID=36817 RepID=UPI003FA1F351